MLIEQIIKTILFEQREVPGKISTDTPSNFAIAKKAGAVVSFNLKLSDAKGLTDDQIRKAIAGTLNGNPTTGPSSKYASGEYIYLISSPKPGNRLKFKVWLIDLKKLRDLAVPLNDIDKTKDYFESGPPSIDFNNFKIGRSIIASVGDMQRWFSILKQRAVEQNIKLTLPNIYKIDKQETEPNLSQYQTKLVNITDENSGEFTSLPTFRGQAKLSYSPENGREIITPITGRIGIMQIEVNEAKRGYFEGEFRNGLPYKGKLVYYQLGSDTDVYSIWEGEVTSTARTKTYSDGTEEQDFEVKRKKGAGKETFKYIPPLDYPYIAPWTNAKYEINTIYYSDTDSDYVYFINELDSPPKWTSANKKLFEQYIDNSTDSNWDKLKETWFPVKPNSAEILNKKHTSAMQDVMSVINKKLNTKVEFKSFPVITYDSTDGKTFIKSRERIVQTPPPQYWLDSNTELGYTKLVGSDKDPTYAYWVKTDTLK
jgi:hypothetical protein